MTDSGKLDYIISEIQGMKSDMQVMQKDLQEVKFRVTRLELGQTEVKKELIYVNRRLEDVYNIALDAWAQGVENRKWLENLEQEA